MGNTYYCNADSGDTGTGDGSEGNPWGGDGDFDTVIGNLSDGDTLILQESTTEYTPSTYEIIMPVASTTGITIKAETFGDATIGPDTVFTGSHTYGQRWKGEGIYNYENLIFDGFFTQNSYGGGLGLFSCSNVNNNPVTYNLTKVKVANYTTSASYNVAGPIAYSIGGATYGDYTANLTNTLIEITGNGFISGNTASSTYDVHITNTNCTFVHRGTGGRIWGGTGNTSSSTITDKNCIYYKDGSSAVYEQSNGTNVSGTNSCYYNITAEPSDSTNIDTDPLFVSYADQNYDLQPTRSPCEELGANT